MSFRLSIAASTLLLTLILSAARADLTPQPPLLDAQRAGRGGVMPTALKSSKLQGAVNKSLPSPNEPERVAGRRVGACPPPTVGEVKPVSFLNEVEPILTRAGCNQGACHGSQFGKGGFKLSLAAYDPDLDYESLVKQKAGRRITFAEPQSSLLVKKAVLAMPHQGGMRLKPDSADYRTLVRWLKQGAPGPNPRDPQLVSIAVSPARRIMQPKDRQWLTLNAKFSDGSVRDVTAHTRISTLNDVIATTTADGLVTAAGHGETAIMLRYGGLAKVARIAVPYGKAQERTTENTEKRRKVKAGSGFVDEMVARRWSDLGLEPSGVCKDGEFIRRASLDVIGTLPTAGEVRAFERETGKDKYARLIDKLLDRPEYVDYWAVKWGDLLRNSRAALGNKAMWSLTLWIRENLSKNSPYDGFVSDIIMAQGSAFSEGAANYYRVATTPQDLTETTAQVFLGIRLQCAKCHQHPFEKWSQRDYYQFAAFFARVGTKAVAETGQTAEPIVRVLPTGEVTHPKSGARMLPTPLALDNGPRVTVGKTDPDADGDRRRALAQWLTGKENRLFAQTLVNRYWGHFLGRGIVHPVDDMRVTNPPSNPELLDALATDFVSHGYDLKHLIRTICTSRAYRLSSRATSQNKADEMFYTHFLPRRQPAEVLLDSLGLVTGTQEKFPGLPLGTRAIQLPDATIGSAFLDTFGRPARSTACECERVGEPSLTQALLMLNGDQVNRKVTQAGGRAAQLAASGKSDREIVEELTYVTLSRAPRPEERKLALQVFAGAKSRRQAVEDLMWALLNTKEFAMVR